MKSSTVNYLMQCALGMCEPEDLTEEEQKYLDELTEDIRRAREKLGPGAKVTFSVPPDPGDDGDDDDGLF